MYRRMVLGYEVDLTMENLKELLEVEKSIKTMINELKQRIIKETVETPLDGVKPISKNICIVKMSNLQYNVWSPEYYLPEKQAEYVEKSLESVSTIHSFVEIIKKTIEQKYVKIGQNRYRLNENTISVLKKYLG